MKESKWGICISGIVLILSILIVLVVNEECMFRDALLVGLDGGFASILILVVTYFTEERKSIYNFYIAAERYTEKLRCFSQYLAESNVEIEKIEEEKDKRGKKSEVNEFKIMENVLNRLEKVCEELYEEFKVMQKETREFEAYSIKNSKRYRIKFYMREIYNSSKGVMDCIKNCDELQRRSNLLSMEGNCEAITFVYYELCSYFIEKDEKDKDKYILVKCKNPDYFLGKFISKGCISLRGGGFVNRNAEYKKIWEADDAMVDSDFSNGYVPSEYSTTCDNSSSSKANNSLNDDRSWINDI